MIYTNKTEKILPYCKKLGKSKDAMWKFSNIAQAIFFSLAILATAPANCHFQFQAGRIKQYRKSVLHSKLTYVHTKG